MPACFSTRASGFGYGDKKGVPVYCGLEAPSPDNYKIRGQFERIRPNVGRTFGVSHKAYEKVYIPNSKQSFGTAENPGPGNYDIKTLIASSSLKYSIKNKLKDNDSATRDNPPPNSYNLNFKLTSPSKFKQISFGFGNRVSVTGSNFFSLIFRNP